MKGAVDVHRVLLDGGVPHEVVRLRRPALSADDLPAALDLPAERCVVVRCYVVDGRVVAVLVRAGAVPDPLRLLDALGARSLRTATADEVSRATDCAAGLVSPVGLPPEVLLLADRALAEADVVYAPAAEGGVVLGIHLADLLAATGARVETLSPRPLAAAERPWDGSADGPAEVVDLQDRRPAR